MNKESCLSQESLKSVLHYDKETGVFKWKVNIRRVKSGSVAGTNHYGKRIMIVINGKSYYAHRLAWLYVYGYWPENEIDHINGNGLDNRIINLRDVASVTNRRNIQKPRKHNKLGVQGVRYRKDKNKYEARITVNGLSKGLGYFSSIEEAADEYNRAKEKYHDDV